MKPPAHSSKSKVTLLVPTDFSAAARNAAHYAVQLGAQIQARIVLLSVIEMDTSETVLSNWKKLETQMRKTAARDLEKLRTELHAVAKAADIQCDTTDGIPFEKAIARYAKDKAIDLIVMGTKGASGLKKIFEGSNTAELMEISPVPVIGVPAKAKYTGMKKIVYATDLKNAFEETKRLAKIAALFNASILVMHCLPANASTRQDRNIEPQLINKAQYGAITFHQVNSDDVDQAIGQFMKKSAADMLVMFTHQRGFFEKALGKSVTRTMAFETRIPLLAFSRPPS